MRQAAQLQQETWDVSRSTRFWCSRDAARLWFLPSAQCV